MVNYVRVGRIMIQFNDRSNLIEVIELNSHLNNQATLNLYRDIYLYDEIPKRFLS